MIVCRSSFCSLLKNEFNRLFSVGSILDTDIESIRDIEKFEIDEVRLLTGENEKFNNKFDVKKTKKKRIDD